MRVSAKSDYALRALIEMATQADADAAISAEELGRRQDIPHGFLQAILADLRRAGIVISQRGQSGGWRMGRAAGEVSVADVIRAVDGPLVSVYGLRPSMSGSPPAGRCATCSSRSRSSSSPSTGCRVPSPPGPPTRTPGSPTETHLP
jgi:Rrf2 family protein